MTQNLYHLRKRPNCDTIKHVRNGGEQSEGRWKEVFNSTVTWRPRASKEGLSVPDASCATNLRSLRSRLEFKVFNATKDWTGRFHYEVAGVRVETTIILEWMKKINGLLHFQQDGGRWWYFNGSQSKWCGNANGTVCAWTRLGILRRNFPAISLEITWTMYYGRTDFTWIVLELIWELNRSV